MLGIIFEIPNEYGSYLSQIFRNVDLAKYTWCIEHADTHMVDDTGNGLTDKSLFDAEELTKEEYDQYPCPTVGFIDWNGTTSRRVYFKRPVVSGEEFAHRIASSKYYLVECDIKAYPPGAESTRTYIKTYDEFIDSDCQIILHYYDTLFIRLFCKDEKVAEAVLDNCKEFGFDNVEVLTPEFMKTIKFSIL